MYSQKTPKMEQAALKKTKQQKNLCLTLWHWKERRHKQHFCFSFLDKYDRHAPPNDRVVSVEHLPVRVSLV